MKLPELAIRHRTFTCSRSSSWCWPAFPPSSRWASWRPDFTIKVAVVSTPYPGATPEEVERDVTDRIETKLQELKQVDYLESSSQEGLSTIKVFIKPTYSSQQIPQVWNELRRKVSDVAPQLPKGLALRRSATTSATSTVCCSPSPATATALPKSGSTQPT